MNRLHSTRFCFRSRLVPGLTSLATVLLPMPVLAHPGHGHGSGYQETDWRSIWHYIIEPEHGLVLVFGVIALGALFYFRKQTPGQDTNPQPIATTNFSKKAKDQ